MLLTLGALAVLLMIGVPTAYALAGSALLAIWWDGIPLTVAAQRIAAGVQSFPLLAIPLFILAGTLMNASGISERLFDLTRALVGHIRGGLAQVNVLANVFMAGVSGSSLADAAATTRVFVPQMVKNGYDKAFSVALTAAAATLAPIIPPSILLVVYGWQANVSIGSLFIAGILPGLFIAACLFGVVAVIARVKGYARGEPFSGARLKASFRQAIWALLMPVIIVVGFRLGVFTATEVAAVAAGYAFVVGVFVYGTVRFADLPSILAQTARDTASILIIVATSAPFAWVLSINQAPQQLLQLITGISENPWAVLLMLNVLLLFIGMFMETIAVIIILIPVLMPLLTTLQIDLVHFGILMIVNLVIGQITPPLGVLMYVTCAISRTSLGRFLVAVAPFLGVLIVALLVITYVPAISLLLPGLIR
ncbi:C4-dicarboxylate transporter DctM subunit [Chelatococcus caeni]|uniref:TRAP transporter large permease protein n=1 Tax=Chelatococcus caeni TaxID=1348468 RepID=A0A840C1Z4_9HYPH|nr:TRAP transporter large permease [Chelatococcus caeni]MBB4017519.1 C4-dicarboxylate transporter DctM subunit [Chelatococcus caeni]